MIQRLRNIEPHAALFLLKNCLWLPKLLYFLRASPAYAEIPSVLQRMDSSLQEALSSLVNVNFRGESWHQAVLPVRQGGLGIRQMSDVALPAHIASLHATESLVAKILPANLLATFRGNAFSAIQSWVQKYPELDPPDVPERDLQKSWDSIACVHKMETLANAADQVGRARILAASSNGSGAWLNAVPSTSFGTLMDRESLRINIALRVGAVVCQPHTCRCGSAVNSMVRRTFIPGTNRHKQG